LLDSLEILARHPFRESDGPTEAVSVVVGDMDVSADVGCLAASSEAQPTPNRQATPIHTIPNGILFIISIPLYRLDRELALSSHSI